MLAGFTVFIIQSMEHPSTESSLCNPPVNMAGLAWGPVLRVSGSLPIYEVGEGHTRGAAFYGAVCGMHVGIRRPKSLSSRRCQSAPKVCMVLADMIAESLFCTVARFGRAFRGHKQAKHILEATEASLVPNKIRHTAVSPNLPSRPVLYLYTQNSHHMHLDGLKRWFIQKG